MSDSEAKPSADTITVRVKDQAGDETFFKIKNTTKMAKVFKAYATRKGVQGKRNLLNLSKNPTNKLPNFVSFSFDLFVFALLLFSISLHDHSPFVLHVILKFPTQSQVFVSSWMVNVLGLTKHLNHWNSKIKIKSIVFFSKRVDSIDYHCYCYEKRD